MHLFKKILISIQTIRNFPLFLADYCGLLNGDILYKTSMGMTFITRSHTPDVAEVIVTLSGKNYPLELTNVPTSKPIIIDIGAYIGDFPLYARWFFRTLQPKIFAFEPDKINFEYMKKNIRINSAEKEIIPIQAAICSYSGHGFINNTHKPQDEYSVTDNRTQHSVSCITYSLWDAFKKLRIRQADILKIDIEGGEYDLLKHSQTRSLINNKVRYVFIEYHKHQKLDDHWIQAQLSNFDLLSHDDRVLTLQNRTIK